jgi:hypothetical protein
MESLLGELQADESARKRAAGQTCEISERTMDGASN